MSGESGVPGGDPRSAAEDGWDWDALLAFIDERRVIPIVGPDLLRIEVDGVPTTFDHYVAKQLAGRMSVPAERLPADPSLNDVVSEYVSMGRGARQDLYPKIRNIVREASFPPPRPLVQLAEITDIDLFVTTTFDGLLESALNTARFGGQPMTETIVYKPKGGADLPRPKETLARTAIFHLFGRASTLPDYVISDEDMLEFIFSLQQEKSRPPLLFDAFRDNHLLLLGVNFADWLARFFLRVAKPGRLSDPRDVTEVVADSKMTHDSTLLVFLHHFSSRTKIFIGGGAVEFVDGLWQRWRALNRSAPARPSRGGAAGWRAPPRGGPRRGLYANRNHVALASERGNLRRQRLRRRCPRAQRVDFALQALVLLVRARLLALRPRPLSECRPPAGRLLPTRVAICAGPRHEHLRREGLHHPGGGGRHQGRGLDSRALSGAARDLAAAGAADVGVRSTHAPDHRG